MNVIYHHRTRASGAEGVHIEGIKKGLMKHGYNITDVSLFSNANAVSNKNDTDSEDAIKRTLNYIADHAPNQIFKIFEILYNFQAFTNLFRAIRRARKNGSEIKFLYDRYSYFCIAPAFCAHIFGINYIVEMNVTGQVQDVRKIHFRRLVMMLERYVARRATVIVVVSNYLKEQVAQLHSIEAERIVVTPNAIDPELFQNNGDWNELPKDVVDTQEQIGNRIVIGFVGVFVPWHGLDLLARAFHHLTKSGHTDAVLLLVGDGPSRAELDIFIEQNNLTDRVFITGMIDHEQVPAYIELFDIAVMPDSNVFGSPIKIFEYMGMYRALLAPDYGPIAEVIDNGVNGLLFEPENEAAMISALEKLLTDEPLRKRLGETAFERVMQSHTWDHNVDRILNTLSNVGKNR